jgi:hypothetical protein
MSNKEENSNYLEQKNYLKAIISGILMSTASIDPENSNSLPFIITALNISMSLVEKLENVDRKLKKFIEDKRLSIQDVSKITEATESDITFVNSLNEFSKFYEKTVAFILSHQFETQISQKILTLFSAASDTLVRAQIFQIEKQLNSLPSWIFSVIDCIKSKYPAVAIIGIRTMQ